MNMKLQTCAEPPISSQTAPECTKPRIKFKKISVTDPRGEGREGKGKEGRRKREEGREREKERGRDGGKGGEGIILLPKQTQLSPHDDAMQRQ